MRLSGVLLLATLAVTAWGAELTRMAEPSLWRYSRPDAQMLVGVNWRRLANTEPGKLLQQQLQQAGVAAANDLQTLNAIDQVLISTMSQGATDKSDPPTLITLKGRFNLVKLRQMAAAKKATIRPYKAIDVITPARAQDSDLRVALVSGDMIVLGDRKSLTAAIDAAHDGGLHSGNALYTRAVELTDRHDLWFATYVPAAAARDAKGSADLLKSVKVIDGGLSAGDKLRLELNLNTGSENEAAKLADVFSAMMAMLPADQKAKLPGGELLSGATVKQFHSAVRIALALDPKDMKKQAGTLGPLMGNLVAGNFDLKGISLPSPPPQVVTTEDGQTTFRVDVAAKAPEQAFIKIYGLDGGTRLIPIQ